MPTAYQPDAIDCDVHCAPARMDDLLPYLSDYWRQYITEAGIRLSGVAGAYPAGAPSSARRGAAAGRAGGARHPRRPRGQVSRHGEPPAGRAALPDRL